METSKYRVTYNDGRVSHVEAVDLYSCVALLGGLDAVMQNVKRIDTKNVRTGEWVETGVFEHPNLVGPSARFVLDEEVDSHE